MLKMNTDYQIQFHGPYSMITESTDILAECPYANDAGIYLWAVQMKDGTYRVTYVGETGKGFYERTKEHLIHIMGGNYRIWDPVAMQEGRYEIAWNGLWKKETKNKFPEFFSQYEVLAGTIKHYILIQNLFVAPLKADRRIRQRIEGALATTIRSDPEASSLLPNDIRFFSRGKDEDLITVNLSFQNTIEGLPPTIEA